MERRLCSLGEILFDFLPVEAGGEVTGFSMHPGGGPYNVAVGMARLGQPTAFVSKVGDDFFGRRLRAAVRAEGIDDRFLATAHGAPTTLAFVANEGGEPAFTFYGEGAADTLLAPEDLPEAFYAETSLLHFGGISLLRGSTPAAALAAVAGLRGRALISFDPNVRPAVIADAAGYRATLERGVAMCDLLKLSAVDIDWLAPGAEPIAYAEGLLAAGPALIMVTRGGAGVMALRRGPAGVERVEAAGFRVQVADTVGAGDSFSAGFLAALAERGVLGRAALEALPADELRAALRFGAAVAAITCTRVGADPPTRAEVEAFVAGADQ
ncbi:carbohydrate kinase [Oscillochloris sp. ZM17-4]|uniref:carbohydrate kinase family protein n=1 Tax=Oscillochloris sp. ZM17-4 TaxID=2866714 RepID=UPI001C732E49|nr:carbohydrate kinase [Oscillochloris sp. ZM17-4]MBX0329379.1 carbohydrate kinase [Oscillochloris sp. ZM17-4]